MRYTERLWSLISWFVPYAVTYSGTPQVTAQPTHDQEGTCKPETDQQFSIVVDTVTFQVDELDHGDLDNDPAYSERKRKLEADIAAYNLLEDNYDELYPLTYSPVEIEIDDNDSEVFDIDIGVPQTFDSSVMDIDWYVELHEVSMRHLVNLALNPDLRHILQECKLKDPLCFQKIATDGYGKEFTSYKNWVLTNCCAAFYGGAQLAFLKRCPIAEGATNAWKAGDVNQYFLNVTTLPQFQKYSPTVYSRPTMQTNSGEMLDDKPWVVTLDNFLSYDEAQRFIAWGEYYGWEVSLDPGPLNEDGTSEPIVVKDRTSRQCWCTDGCLQDPMVRNVLQRISEVTFIPETNSDFLQMLKYRPTQFYFEHHDSHDFQVYSATGHRIMTVMLYLAGLDKDQEGGTNFPRLENVTVQPKLGRVLIWPNVLDSDPNVWDPRLHHQALPVASGMKYAATAWLHMRDFKGPAAFRCDED